jgi:hypothetical protein
MLCVKYWGWDFLLEFFCEFSFMRIHPIISMPVGDMRINWQAPKLVSDVWRRRF